MLAELAQLQAEEQAALAPTGAVAAADHARYLDGLAADLYRLPLGGLEAGLEDGDGIALPQVYVGLATHSLVEVVRGRSRELRKYYEEGKLDGSLKQSFHPDYALPDAAIVRAADMPDERQGKRAAAPRALFRARLASEAVAAERRLVLLGDPGAGKSTFARHLAWALALGALDPKHAPKLLG